MTSRTVSSRNLVSQNFIQFIRPQTIKLTLIEARPNTKMNVFFGDDNVTVFCNLIGNSVGTPLITDTIGQAVIQLNLPGGRFNTGTYDITLTDANSLEELEIGGSVFGSAKGAFSSTGRVDFFQTTQVTTTTVTRTVNVQRDPLAQSFFTFGVEGGIFVSSIEVYFQSKDNSLPVRCELRELVNGFPSPLDPNNPLLVSVLDPQNITTSQNASVPSKFVFSPPMYLKGDSDYCFVLRSRSNNYNVFTSRMGEVSIEDGRKIFDQPYIGSLFKSENDVTWTAEQFEDIKFKINKAVFSSAPATIEFSAVVPPLGATGKNFFTSNGSNIVTYVHSQDHGLEVGSKFKIVTQSDITFYNNATYNGIPYTQFNTSHDVISVTDRKTLTFQVSSNATSTGPIENETIVSNITVLSGGSNYSPTDTVVFTGGGGGTGAAAQIVVDSNGTIQKATIINGGSGYTSIPTAVVVTSTGLGAVLSPSVLPTFTVFVNKPMTGFMPKLPIFNFGDTKTKNTLYTTLGNHEGGNLVTYNPGKSIEFVENYPYFNIEQNSLVASRYNEIANMSQNYSARLGIELNSNNTNLSPMLYFSASDTSLQVYSDIINQQSGETLTSSNSSGSITSFVITAAGSNYTSPPNVIISPPDLYNGVQATANTTLTSNAVSQINIIEDGSGYTSVPTVIISPVPGDVTGSGAAAQAILNPFNTEVLPSGGKAKARYISKKNTLQIVSNGVRLFSVISSTPGSYVDWYIRTSLSGSGIDHETQNWTRLNCNVDRNRSSYVGEFYEYEFKLDNISDYDTYDLKCVMGSENPIKNPIIKSYRVIVVS